MVITAYVYVANQCIAAIISQYNNAIYQQNGHTASHLRFTPFFVGVELLEEEDLLSCLGEGVVACLE